MLILGTRSQQHLLKNIGAIDVALPTADLAIIRAAPTGVEVEGGRMNTQQMKFVETASRPVAGEERRVGDTFLS